VTLDSIQYALGGASGGLVGLSLGLFGGGGSILAAPLMVYVVGVPSAHMAIGTSALAVAANAGTSLLAHARRGNVKWRCAAMFSVAGVAGALLGSSFGKAVDGQKLLFLFALLMIVVGALMLRSRGRREDGDAECTIDKAPKILSFGAAAGAFSGFFGIGGGFLIVPGLVASTGMPMLMAVGSSLVAVTAFGLTTALSYAVSGYVDWPLALIFVAGGVVGGSVGTLLACRAAKKKGALTMAFAGLIFAVAIYMIAESASAWSP
jgi:uncharacterized membrane protein YfcA